MQQQGQGLIYAPTRHECETWSQRLQDLGFVRHHSMQAFPQSENSAVNKIGSVRKSKFWHAQVPLEWALTRPT